MKHSLNSNSKSAVEASKESLYKKAHRSLEFEIREEENKALIDELKMTNQALIDETKHRKQIEEKLLSSEVQFRLISTSANDAIIMIDNDSIVSFWNKAAEEIFGYSTEDAVGKSLVRLVIPEKYQEAHMNGFEKFKYTGHGPFVGKTVRLSAVRKDGTEFPVSLSLSAVLVKDKWNAIGIVRDITERKQMEDILQESEDKFRSISDSANDAIIMLDNDEKIIYWNNSAERIFGHLRDEAEGENISELIIPERFREKHLEGFESFRSTGTGNMVGKMVEVAGIRKDGSEIPIELSLSSVKLKNKWCAIALIRDITERKKADDQINKLSHAVAQSSCSILITDGKGIIEYVNPKFTRVTGYTFAEAVGENPSILKSGKQSTEVYRGMWETITSGKEWRGEFYNKRKDGEFIWEYASISPVKNDKGVITNFIGVKEDISKRKQIEEELRISHKMSSIGRLSASVFHEILNPVNIISAHTQILLMEAAKGSKTEEDLKSIQDEIDRIVNITDNLLKFSVKEDTETEETEINGLLENALSLIKPELHLKSIKYITKLEEDLPEVTAHGSELREAFLKLITNSIEAMPEGGTLTIKTLLKGESIKISFSDTGCGIAKENIDKIFEPFFSTKKEIKGVGLGLSSSYAIIESYGGRISVESEEGKGATFIIDLPVKG
ncbi:MAG: PAS domain S-box protein [Candidatus Brocadiales bacterium]|nr:PAS domain S-box protein [Candidatus Brocadiales bacterium]